MDNSEDPPLCRFGTPLEPLEEDDVSAKKRIAIEDQIVTDENGRRRFHGAFTGGFSAGFWNTVGSLEGWKPQSFKSSRSEKAEKRQSQLPTDFMDDEDLGEFGIAPQRVQARKDFATHDETLNRKRKLENTGTGPIPGIPVLQQIIEPSREKVAVRLLRRMGWKPGQGVGARQTKKEKSRSNVRNSKEIYVMKMYGCAIKSKDGQADWSSEDNSELSDEEEITFAPDDFEPFVCSIKDNIFGLGYHGLSRQLADNIQSHVNLFGPLEVMGKSNNKLSIRGQAFGVGALEEEDEDIYARDDMTKYDFSLGEKRKREKQKTVGAQDLTLVEGFAEPKNNSNTCKIVHRIDLKSNFEPRNWMQRKTRFDPLPDDKIAILQNIDVDKKRGLGRHDLNPDKRGLILDGQIKKITEVNVPEEDSAKKTYLQHISEKYKEREERNKKVLELLSSKADNFVRGGLITNEGVEETQAKEVQISEDVKNQNNLILADAKQITKTLGSCGGTFKPFSYNEAKQERYEKFTAVNLRHDDEIKTFLNTIQPVHLSEWDREMEKKEFIQARSIYKPLNGLMSERFVSKSTANVPNEISRIDETVKTAKIIFKRSKNTWKPSSIICKRFNIPEPFGGSLVEPKVSKKNKFSVFDYIENSMNSKKDFVTPVIIPKHVEKPKELKNQNRHLESFTEKTTDKELLPMDKSLIIPTSKASTTQSVSKVDATHLVATSTQNVKINKTELELRVEESRNKHPSEKKDLFMSIFDSSSDNENDSEKDTENPPNTAITDEVIQSLIKPSPPVNALRNDSPPRGIFAALFSTSAPKKEDIKEKYITTAESLGMDKFEFKSKKARHLQEIASEPDDTYGPKVPSNFTVKTTKSVDIDRRLADLLSSKSVKSTKLIEKWVEKTDETSKKKKGKKDKKKKDRKEKHKHKKLKKHKK